MESMKTSGHYGIDGDTENDYVRDCRFALQPRLDADLSLLRVTFIASPCLAA